MWLRPRCRAAARRHRCSTSAASVTHFDFARTGRVVTNNAASTQPPRELLDLYRRARARATRTCTAASRRRPGGRRALFEESYDTIAAWLNAPSRRSIATYRNTTEAINAVMYSLLTEFRDGDNVVTTMMEHNSNFVPWYALCREILPRFGRRVECRVARFDHATGRARPRPPRVAGRRAHQAGLLHRRVELPRHQAAAGRRPRDRRRERLPRSRTGERRLAAARRRRPARAEQRRRRPGRSTSTTWRSRSTSCSRRSASASCTRKEHLLEQVAAVPLRRRHDRRGAGRPRTTSSTTTCRGSTPPGTPNILGVDRLGAGPAAARSTWSSARGEPRVLRHGAADAARRPSRRRWAASARTPAGSRPARSTGCARSPGSRVYGPRDAAPRGRRWSRSTSPASDPIELADGLERARRRVTRRLPLRDARAPRPRPDAAGQLPAQLRALHHRRRRRPRGAGGRRGRRPAPRTRTRPPFGTAGDAGKSVLAGICRGSPHVGVAPFKAQNIDNNCGPRTAEIGRASCRPRRALRRGVEPRAAQARERPAQPRRGAGAAGR